jgi:hypothetical protein
LFLKFRKSFFFSYDYNAILAATSFAVSADSPATPPAALRMCGKDGLTPEAVVFSSHRNTIIERSASLVGLAFVITFFLHK